MRYLPTALLLIGLWGCRREIPLPNYEDGLSLFPLKTGLSWIYEVRETTYTTIGAEPRRFFLRMRIDTPTVDAYGRPSWYVVWDTTPDLSAGWGFFRVGLAYRDSSQAELWENNRRLLILRFPLSPYLTWNRHEYTDLPPESCRYISIDTTYRLNNTLMPRSAFILRKVDTIGILKKAVAYEVYTRDIGLIHQYERLDAYDLRPNGSLVRSTDSYHWEVRLIQP
ncbi:MAG: hypothetical protein NZZ60_04710 [Bacteroidia bacterium]|nr:hypothetical protein [Bacteroidia bacterium]MCX7651549.1 hypothetical protein [Bacteroidia bacterium]MDW8416255.1 hypothetical protein [Bacteroidia bacterium]